KNKFSGFFNWMPRHRPYLNTSAGINASTNYAPTGTMVSDTLKPFVAQVKWTGTLSNHLLVEAGYSINHYKFYTNNQDFVTAEAIKKVDTTLSNQWSSGDGNTTFDSELQNYVGRVSYVTGTHAVKGGVQFQKGMTDTVTTRSADLFQQYQNGKPFQV